MRVDAAGPPVEDLRTFALLAELGSVTEVAARLGIDPSGVSRRLQSFRGPPYHLLRRQGGGLVLTDRGRELLPVIRSMLREYDSLAALLKQRPADKAALVVAIGGFGAIYLLPEAIARFARIYPNCEVLVRVARSRERVVGFGEGRYDLAIISHSPDQIRSLLGDDKVVAEPLPPRPFLVAARSDTVAGKRLSALPRDQTMGIREMAGLVLVGLDDGASMRTRLERQADDAGVRLEFAMTGGGWLAAHEYARNGLGAALLPSECLSEAHWQELIVRNLAEEFWPSDHVLSRLGSRGELRAFREVLAEPAMFQVEQQKRRLPG
jgi:DNA-binding transcriptional LysR family regulator